MAQQPSGAKELLRIALEGDGAVACQSMIKQLLAQEPNLKITPSRFMTVVACRYFEKNFDSEAAFLADQFFDLAAHIEAAMQNSKTEIEMREVLSKGLARASRKDQERRTRRKLPDSEPQEPKS